WLFSGWLQETFKVMAQEESRDGVEHFGKDNGGI
ncbi:unnamed protein product, partial [marine sediment metagenome]